MRFMYRVWKESVCVCIYIYIYIYIYMLSFQTLYINNAFVNYKNVNLVLKLSPCSKCKLFLFG